MTDVMTTEQRSRVMSRIRSKDSKPELQVRSLVYSMGFRYRLHVRKLPGCPDIVFWKRMKVIFVHGCFWHRHEKCPYARLPKSNRAFWTPKLNANRARDRRNQRTLKKLGWSCLVIWECEVKNPNLPDRIRTFLNENVTALEQSAIDSGTR